MRIQRSMGLFVFIMSFFILTGSLSAGFAQEREESAVEPEILEQYVGTYELAPNFNIMITLEGNQLSAQASGQGEFPIYAETETKFFYKVVDARIEFFKNDQGEVTRLVLYQNNQEIPGRRISGEVAERKEVSVSPEIVKQYVGTYELRPGFDMVITLENGQLMSQATGQGKIPIFVETETKFFVKVVDAQIEFLKDENGVVTHLMLHQGPTEIKAPRK